MEEPKLQTNLDTNLLKLIAVVSMTIDHIGLAFFPQYPVFRWIGRMAFPLFCYCMTVGMLYTRDIKKYLLRLGAFALISQPFWILAFNADDFLGNLFNLNIFFTLVVSLAAVWGAKEKKWWLLAAGVVLLCVVNFDYALGGVELMLIFYYCRNKPKAGALLFALSYLIGCVAYPGGDPLDLNLGSFGISFSTFSLLALPLIYLHTNSKLKINRWFFYIYYPAHLLAIYLFQLIL